MLNEREAYRLLGITPEATPLEVRAAFRRGVMERHPDTGGDAGDESTVQDLVHAYRLLAGPSSATSEVGGARVEVRHRPGASSAGRERIELQCSACGGSGVRVERAACRQCGGSARVTILDLTRARVSSCPACRGRGQRLVVSECGVCDGRGSPTGGQGR